VAVALAQRPECPPEGSRMGLGGSCTIVPPCLGEQASSDAAQYVPSSWAVAAAPWCCWVCLGRAGQVWLRVVFLPLLPQVFESSNQSSCNESTCKDLLPKKRRRTRIPDKPNYSLNLWSIMKNCIGKELSKIPMPVSEPAPAPRAGRDGDASAEG